MLALREALADVTRELAGKADLRAKLEMAEYQAAVYFASLTALFGQRDELLEIIREAVNAFEIEVSAADPVIAKMKAAIADPTTVSADGPR